VDAFLSSGYGRDTLALIGPLERANLKGHNRAIVSFPSPEDENKTTFLNAMFYGI
jgi:hypothetical protein